MEVAMEMEMEVCWKSHQELSNQLYKQQEHANKRGANTWEN